MLDISIHNFGVCQSGQDFKFLETSIELEFEGESWATPYHICIIVLAYMYSL